MQIDLLRTSCLTGRTMSSASLRGKQADQVRRPPKPRLTFAQMRWETKGQLALHAWLRQLRRTELDLSQRIIHSQQSDWTVSLLFPATQHPGSGALTVNFDESGIF